MKEAPHVQQARAELVNAKAQGNASAELAARKRLAAAGADEPVQGTEGQQTQPQSIQEPDPEPDPELAEAARARAAAGTQVRSRPSGRRVPGASRAEA